MKTINLTISGAAIKKAFFSFTRRFHVVIFVVIVLGGVAASVFILNSIVVRSTDASEFSSETSSVSFDKETIKRIEDLKTRDQGGATLDLSKGRTNPFVE